jgi:hypothetical protein
MPKTKMNTNKQADYQKNYRENYGNVMKGQVREWFKKHSNYLKEWRKTHPKYFQEY